MSQIMQQWQNKIILYVDQTNVLSSLFSSYQCKQKVCDYYTQEQYTLAE